VRADDARARGLEHRRDGRFLDARDIQQHGVLPQSRANGADHLLGRVDRHADDHRIGDRGGVARAERGIDIGDDHLMAQVAEQANHERAHTAASTDDGDGSRLRLVRQLRAQ